jgi:hypothetical protein
MKKFLFFFTGLVTTLAFYSFNTDRRVDDLLKELGIPAAHAKNYVWKSFIGESFSLPSNSNIENYPRNKQATAVQVIGAYIKDYLISADFAKQYQILREERKPALPKSVAERLKKELNNLYLALKEAENACGKASTELKPIYDASIRKYKQSINALENDYDPQHAAQIQGIITQYDYDMSDYRFRLKQFEKKYPADVKLFIRNRLQDFLQLSSTVDFDADVKLESNGQKFADPAYEERSQAWKYCFLAGRDATTAARKLAAKWIKEI